MTNVEEEKQPEAPGTNQHSLVLPTTLFIGGLLLEASAKPIAKALVSGLQDRANIEGVIAVISGLTILIGIGLFVRAMFARRKAG